MSRRAAIPVNRFGESPDESISIDRVSFASLPPLGEWEQPERHDRHSFFLLESGSVTMEIDFRQVELRAPALIYMHPDQVHRILGFRDVTVWAWAVTNEELRAEYLAIMEDLSPLPPILPDQDQFTALIATAGLMKDAQQRKQAPLYHALLLDHANTLVGLALSLLLEHATSATPPDRAAQLTRTFRQLLGKHFRTAKSPGHYAEMMHLSLPYLNECVKASSGQPVSWHIQQRVTLEAKRLLFHSELSLKEIAVTLGYDDYAYFSRLFRKTESLSPAAFRQQNFDSSKSFR